MRLRQGSVALVDGEGQVGKSDLGMRTVSAFVMLAVAGTALWLGGYAWVAFVLIVAAGVLFEWRGLARQFPLGPTGWVIWNLAGILYIGFAAAMLLAWRTFGISEVLVVLLAVISTDVGAYFAGRTIGGPKIAPRISPSKTWAGLAGGIVGASLVFGIYLWSARGTLACDMDAWHCSSNLGLVVGAIQLGAGVAVIAQAGDFFESWMKRRAGVKDSSNLIPGHGGLFDRVDGLLSVSFVAGVLYIATQIADLGS